MANIARTTASSVVGELAGAGLITIGYGKLTLLAWPRLRVMVGK
jgi:hypothetical protein